MGVSVRSKYGRPDDEIWVTVRVPKECQVSDRSADRRASVSTTNAAAAAEIGREAERLLIIARLQEQRVTARSVLKQAAATLAGPAAAPLAPILAEYIPEWMAHHRNAWKKSTRENYESIIRVHLLPTLGDTSLDDVTRRLVRRWVGELAAGGLSRKTISNIVRCLSSILSSAVHDEILQTNPVMRLRHVIPRVRSERRSPRAWHPQQMERILAAADDVMPTPDLRALVPVLEATGLRIGEALGLQWDDIDLETGQLEIRRARVRGETTSPKSRQERRLWVPKQLLPRLRALRVDQERRAVGEGREVSAWVFQTSTGNPYDASVIRGRYWSRVVRRAKVPNHGFHGFRHYRASRWLLDGVPVLRVARWLGHSSPHTTWTTYAHVLDAIEDQVAQESQPPGPGKDLPRHPVGTFVPDVVRSTQASGC